MALLLELQRLESFQTQQATNLMLVAQLVQAPEDALEMRVTVTHDDPAVGQRCPGPMLARIPWTSNDVEIRVDRVLVSRGDVPLPTGSSGYLDRVGLVLPHLVSSHVIEATASPSMARFPRTPNDPPRGNILSSNE